MIEQDKNWAIAMLCGRTDRWVLMKHGLYYRQEGHGYTAKIEEAWIVTEKEASEHVYPHDEPVTKHALPPPDYLNDYNTRNEMITVVKSRSLEKDFGEKLFKVVIDLDGAKTAEALGFKVWLGASCTQAEFCHAFLETMFLADL